MNASIATNQTILVGRNIPFRNQQEAGYAIRHAGGALLAIDERGLWRGGSAKQAGLDGHIIQPRKLQEIAGK